MPQKTVFIRDEDLDKWNSIEKKSAFIHEALIKIMPPELKNRLFENQYSEEDKINKYYDNIKLAAEPTTEIAAKAALPKIIKTKQDAEAWVGPLTKQHSARKKSKRL